MVHLLVDLARDFRCFSEADFQPDPGGLTVLRGPNGAGKTSVLEAVGWLATQRSIRASHGTRSCAVAPTGPWCGPRPRRPSGDVLVEAEIPAPAGSRTQVNRQPVRRRADLAEAAQRDGLRAQRPRPRPGRPGGARRRSRRRPLVLDAPASTARRRFDRILRQRGAVLRQAGGRPDSAIAPPSTCGTTAWPRPGPSSPASARPWRRAHGRRPSGLRAPGRGRSRGRP